MKRHKATSSRNEKTPKEEKREGRLLFRRIWAREEELAKQGTGNKKKNQKKPKPTLYELDEV